MNQIMDAPSAEVTHVRFVKMLKDKGLAIVRDELKTVQINLGSLCNQVCDHCHIEGTRSSEKVMPRQVMKRIIELLKHSPEIQTVDITGGAPEMNPDFRFFVEELSHLGKEIIVRSNLTILLEPGQEDTPLFFKDHKVHVISSLPCYTSENVEKQRGRHVFSKSLVAMKILNRLGYAEEGTDLLLDLVYNPLGAYLPPDQSSLEVDYKANLDHHGVRFNRLLTLTNMPIRRFAEKLAQTKELDGYIKLLETSFNETTVSSLMCRSSISINWEGKLFDCDFNHVLDVEVPWEQKSIWDLERFETKGQKVALGDHCFGCTAGSGSSCGGALN